MKLIPLTLMLAITVVAALACAPITSSSSDCPDCMTVAQIIKDYETNAIRAKFYRPMWANGTTSAARSTASATAALYRNPEGRLFQKCASSPAASR